MLRQRIISGASLLLALFAAAFLLPVHGIGVLVMVLGLISLVEYSRLLRQAGIIVFSRTLLGCGMLLSAAAFLDHAGQPPLSGARISWELFALALSLLAIMIRAMGRTPNSQTLTAAAFSVLGLLYLPFLLNFYMRLALTGSGPGTGVTYDGRILSLFPIVVVKVSDMGAFFAGRRFGRHKLCPGLSPGKTWEGLGGGLAAAIATALVFVLAFPAPDAWSAAWRIGPATLSAVVLALLGVAGDLAESFLKRAAGVKDSSGVLPGMGGVLDVFDSLLFTAPAFYAIVRLSG